MRLGFAPSGRRRAAEAVLLAQIADTEGFDEVWVSEDYCERGAFSVAGALAAATSRVTVGLGVVNPWTRHPVLLAMEAAALDEVSAGRAVLGLGASSKRWMDDLLGIPYDKPITRLTDCLVAVRELLAGGHVSRTVCGYDIDTRLSFPALRPDLPLVMGVKGNRALGKASDLADGVLLSVLSSPAYITWARARAPQGGRGVAAYVLFSHHEEASKAKEQIRPIVARFLGIHGPHDITRVGGMDHDLAMEFQRRLASGESAVGLVTDEILDTFAIAGDTDACVAGLSRFAEAGADSLVIVDTAQAGVEARATIESACRCAQEAGLLADPLSEAQ